LTPVQETVPPDSHSPYSSSLNNYRQFQNRKSN
jgi:hypothetical protein